jgi:hypothetical protein
MFDEELVKNSLWVLGNILGDTNTLLNIRVIDQTCLFEFLGTL